MFVLYTAGQETVLYNFPAGAFATSGVTRGTAGDLFGTADGGTKQGGFVYKLTTQ